MSLEPGGRADKYGNKYENRYLAKLLIRLVREEITSVTVEPIGPNGDSVEFISEEKSGAVKHYQCKASNTTHTSWSVADLERYNVFKRAKDIVTADPHNLYYFISPLQYNKLDELCKRARTNSSATDFVNYQLTNPKIRGMFNDCKTRFKFDSGDSSTDEKAVDILSRCYFEQYITGMEAEQDFEALISTQFTGKASLVRVLLEQYANDTGRYGVKITARDIVDYMEERDFHIRNYLCNTTVLSRIEILNNTHWDVYHAIHGNLVHRTASDNILQNIKDGHSVVLHGKAGSGKSGCLEEVIYNLKQAGILYLAVKLDKHMPSISADAYGQELGLPESPAYCLATLSAGKPCVLILDQLDALRWTSNHSGSALDVCKEIIRHAEAINKDSNGKLSIIFASRTFDLENDKGLKDLFTPSDSQNSLRWAKVNVNRFTKNDVAQIIGARYNSLSLRLQDLLQTPSSLYVWSQLEENEQRNSIASVYELMSEWWNQIQQKCARLGLKTESITACKSKIVEAMEKSTVFFLPQALFMDQANEIDFLVSVGILNRNLSTKSISFTHQSFLDYFITSELLNKIYLGEKLSELVGPRIEQTPIIRYRLLTVLQNLIECNTALFVAQSNGILQSDSVRFYFKCTIFEVIGQCHSPAPEIFKIVDDYAQKKEWVDYIVRVVYYGHPAFIKQLKDFSDHTFPSDQLLSLLGSISDTEPDFVVEILRPHALQDSVQDRKIFFSLCYDTNNDSDSMFDLRIQLLKKNPILFQNFWGFQELFEKLSPKALVLMRIIVESWPKTKSSDVYFGDESKIEHYVKRCAWDIITQLFPIICETTSEYTPSWPNQRWYSDYEDWTPSHYHKSAVREIVDIVKSAFAECAHSSPEELLAFIEKTCYPLPAVGHECIMFGIQNLPIEYADQAITWLLADVEQKIFDFSAKEEDFLYSSKQIIRKFSPFCEIALFRQLEGYICNWREPLQKMKDMFLQRAEVRKEHHACVYYAYWGHFQKALLPSMAPSRLTVYSKQLLHVVNRNSWINLPHFFIGFTCGSAKTVVSPIDKKTGSVSDKTWLQIISTPQDKMRDRFGGAEKQSCYVEATHESFSSSLGMQAKHQPMRFAKLALSFPENCDEHYVCGVLHALYDNESKDRFDVDLVSQVIQRYGYSEKHDVAIVISRVVEKHAGEKWPPQIIGLIENFALNHPHPAKDEYVITSSSDPDHKSSHSLIDNSLNCVRGCALRTIAALLWENNNLGSRFKKAILKASTDANDAVRFAVMSCVLPYYNIDKKFAVSIFTALTETDLRTIAAHEYWEILVREYDHNSTYYRNTLIAACESGIVDLSECAAGFLCAVGIYLNDHKALNYIMTHHLSKEQQGRICMQAVSSFNIDKFHEDSKMILTHLMDHAADELQGFNRLFFDRCIVLQRDEEFLIHLMGSSQSVHLLHSFLDYLYESDEDICGFANIMNAVGNSLAQMPQANGPRLIVSDLVKCVVRLFDKGKDEPSICEICLNIWDKLFMSNLRDIKPLSDMIDNFE